MTSPLTLCKILYLRILMIYTSKSARNAFPSFAMDLREVDWRPTYLVQILSCAKERKDLLFLSSNLMICQKFLSFHSGYFLFFKGKSRLWSRLNGRMSAKHCKTLIDFLVHCQLASVKPPLESSMLFYWLSFS